MKDNRIGLDRIELVLDRDWIEIKIRLHTDLGFDY